MAEKANTLFGGMVDSRHCRHHDVQRRGEEGSARYFRGLVVRILSILDRLVWLPVAFIGLSALAMALMLMDNTPPGMYVPGSQTVVVEQDRVVLTYRWTRQRFCDTVFTRSIIDPAGKLEHLTAMSYTADQIKELQAADANYIHFVLPKPTKPIPGVYRMQGLVLHSCNFAQVMWPIKVPFVVPYRLIPE